MADNSKFAININNDTGAVYAHWDVKGTPYNILKPDLFTFQSYVIDHQRDPGIHELYQRVKIDFPSLLDGTRAKTVEPAISLEGHMSFQNPPKSSQGKQGNAIFDSPLDKQPTLTLNAPPKPAPQSAERPTIAAPADVKPAPPKESAPVNNSRATSNGPDKADQGWHMPIASNLYESGTAYINEQKRNSDYLQKQLGDYVDAGGNPILAAIGASALDIGVMAMETTWGFTDPFLNLGSGLGKGGYEGVKEEAQRVLGFIPGEGALVRKGTLALNAAFYGIDI